MEQRVSTSLLRPQFYTVPKICIIALILVYGYIISLLPLHQIITNKSIYNKAILIVLFFVSLQAMIETNITRPSSPRQHCNAKLIANL